MITRRRFLTNSSAIALTSLGIADALAQGGGLAQSGLVIDRQIDIMGYDAYETMLTRRLYGYTWVPSAFQMITFPPPGFALPAEPVDPSPSMIDFSQIWPEKNGWFSTQAGYAVAAGQEHEEGGKTYIKIVMPWPFGAYHGWTLRVGG